MTDMPVTPPAGQVPPWAPVPDARPARGRRLLKLAVGVGAAAGVAVGATALAQAATSSGTAPHTGAASVTASDGGTTTTTLPPGRHGFGGAGRFRGGMGVGGLGGIGGLGGPASGAGPFIYGQFTIKGPNGYETISERTGTVSDITDTSGSTWSLTVKSADGTSGTFTVDSTTSVNGQAGHRPDDGEGERRIVAADGPAAGQRRIGHAPNLGGGPTRLVRRCGLSDAWAIGGADRADDARDDAG